MKDLRRNWRERLSLTAHWEPRAMRRTAPEILASIQWIKVMDQSPKM